MNKVYFGDCRDSMRQMAKDGIKVQTCITSPPYYGLRDYGNGGQIGLEESPKKFVESLVEVFACVWDILEDDGTLWMNLGDSYSAGGRGGGQEGGIQAGNKGSVTGEVFGAWKVEGFRPKNLLGIPWRVAIAMQDFGWNLRQDIIWHKPNPMPESVTDRCTKAHEYIFLFSKKQKYYFDHEAIKEPVKEDWGTRDRANGKYHNEGTGLTPHTGLEKSYEMANKRSVWTVNTSTYKGAHFATFPEKLIEPMILAGSRVGDIVLDPFFGSGTTGQVSQNLGRKWIGCELNQDYEQLQNERLKQQGLELV
jgi:DNA modification methylase